MKTNIIPVRIALLLAMLLPAKAVLAESGDIRVDVVVDVTEAGEKVAHPTPDKPAYYLPVTVGYKQMGGMITGQKAPPAPATVQHLLAEALFAQGYHFNKTIMPSLVFVFWWGYMAPESVEMQSFDSVQGGQVPTMDMIKTGAMGSSMMSLGDMQTNQGQMLALVRGDKPMDETHPFDPRVREAMDAGKQPRYYVLISAFDFKSWQSHKPILLWRAHISTDLLGRQLDDVLPAMITAATPSLGRDTAGPQFVESPSATLGRVLVGTPEVKNFSSPAGK